MQGRVKFFNACKGRGCTTPSDSPKDLNARSGDVQHDGGHNPLSGRQEVEFELSEGPQGPQTSKVSVIE